MGIRARRTAGSALLLLALLLASSTAPGQETDLPFQGLYVLSFDRWGDLQSPGELDLAIRELHENREIDRIIIFSYGWANDGEASHATYRAVLRELASHAAYPERVRRAAVIAVGWDSSMTGFRKLFNDLIPLPGVANALAWLPDNLLFPISFWSKAAQADRIGLGGLRTSLNRIFREAYGDRDDHPEVLLMGHSFGARILSGLMKDRLGLIPVRTEPFVAAEHVVGAGLMQPALVLANLDQDAHYPILATMSEHDHALGFLFPVANLVINAFGFTAFEALVQHEVLGRVERTARSTIGTVTDRIGRQGPGEEPDDSEGGGGGFERTMELTRRAADVGRRTAAELASIPVTAALTATAIPVSYVYTQTRALVTRPVPHLLDSLAQLPLVEVPVALVDRALGRPLPSGRRSKGIFELGPLHESVGRLVTPAVIAVNRPPVVTPEELLQLRSRPGECGLPRCRGVTVVDATDLVTSGAFGQDLGNPIVDFTIGWIDPIGAHGDYRNAEVMEVMARVLGPPPPGEGHP